MSANVSVERSIQTIASARGAEMRKRAVVALTRSRSTLARLALLRALRDDSAQVRKAAASALTQTPKLGRPEATQIVRALRAQAKRERSGRTRAHLERAASAVLRRRRNAGISPSPKAKRPHPDSPHLGAVRRLKQRSAQHRSVVQSYEHEMDDELELWWAPPLAEDGPGDLCDLTHHNGRTVQRKLEGPNAPSYASLSCFERWSFTLFLLLPLHEKPALGELLFGPVGVRAEELEHILQTLEAKKSLEALRKLWMSIGSPSAPERLEEIAQALFEDRPALNQALEKTSSACSKEGPQMLSVLSRCELTSQIQRLTETEEPYRGFDLHPGSRSAVGEVQADWLLEQGDRSQEFAALQRAAALAPGNQNLKRYKRAFYRSHRHELLPDILHRASQAWHNGALRGVELSLIPGDLSYRALLSHPSTAQLRSLDLCFVSERYPSAPQSISNLVERGSHPLRRLRLQSWSLLELWLGDTLSALPRLRELIIETPVTLRTSGPLQHEGLRALRLPAFGGPSYSTFRLLRSAWLPRLKRLYMGKGSALEVAKVLPTITGIRSVAHLETEANAIGALESECSAASVLPALRSLSLRSGPYCEKRSAQLWRLLTTGGLKNLEILRLNSGLFSFLEPSFQSKDQLLGVSRLRLDDLEFIAHILNHGLNAPQLRVLELDVDNRSGAAFLGANIPVWGLPKLERIVLHPDRYLSFWVAEAIECWWKSAQRKGASSGGIEIKIQHPRYDDQDVRELFSNLRRAQHRPEMSAV